MLIGISRRIAAAKHIYFSSEGALARNYNCSAGKYSCNCRQLPCALVEGIKNINK